MAMAVIGPPHLVFARSRKTKRMAFGCVTENLCVLQCANAQHMSESDSRARHGAVDESEFAPAPGAEMAEADAMGILNDEQLLMRNDKLRAMLDNDQRFSDAAIQQRVDERMKRANQQQQQQQHASSSAAPGPVGPPKSGEPVPDVIALGFCKLVFEYLAALKQRFPKREMIAKTYEMFWTIAEKAPTMPYEKFRDLLDGVGSEMLNAAIQSDAKLARRVQTLRDRIAAPEESAEKNAAKDQYRRIVSEHGLRLFEERQKARDALPKDQSLVTDAQNMALFEQYEVFVLRHLVKKVHLFRFARLDAVWRCDAEKKLDLQTRDRNMAYAHRLCKVTDLINNFDPSMRALINEISVDSLKSVNGKDKRSINIDALLEELQERIINNDEFMDKITEIASRQAGH